MSAGRYLVALVSQPSLSGYVNLVQVPDGPSEAEAKEQLLSAARFDAPVPSWTYGGGTFAFGGDTAWIVFALIAQGHSNSEIAARLYLSPKTVRNHNSSIFEKIQVTGRAQTIVRAREAGLGREAP